MNVSLAQSAAALNATMRWQESIAENLASSSIPGFKKQEISFGSFESGRMRTAEANPSPFVLPSANPSTNFISGDHRHTGVATDVAMDGPGFLEIQLPNGDTAYTRDGVLRFDSTGLLVTKEGFQIQGRGGPVQSDPTSAGEISVSPSGVVSQGELVIGNLQAMEFGNPQLLTPISRGLFLADHPDLEIMNAEGTQFRQGYLESANTSPASEMAQMINAMRIYEANQRAMQSQDERMGKAITSIGNNS